MRLKNNVYLVILFIFITSFNNPVQKTIEVEINNNVETLSILYLLADVGLNPLSGSMSSKAREHFKPYKEHNAVRMVNILMEANGFGTPIEVGIHLSQLPEAKLIHNIDKNYLISISENQNEEEGKIIIDQFISALNDFYNTAHVDDFIRENEEYYRNTINDVLKNLPGENFISTMENFYGKENLSYTLIPSPIFYPFCGLGFRIKKQKGLKIYNIFGPLVEKKDTSKYTYGFDNEIEIIEKSVHEFGHSFVNPLTELPQNRKIIQKYSYLFEPIKEHMEKQGYDNWWVCVTEHLVRLGEIRISYAQNDSARANRLRENYVKKKKFIYIPALEEKIELYEQNREHYKSFEDFLPELLETFSQIDPSRISIENN